MSDEEEKSEREKRKEVKGKVGKCVLEEHKYTVNVDASRAACK